MVELELSAQLAVSRTPIRIALGELEKEGLLERLPTRGFRVRQFSVDEIANAVDVRGVLEGMAARQAAERGLSPDARAELQACITEGHLLLEKAEAAGHVIDAARWVPMNARFHAALVEAAGNSTLASALAHVSKTPMAGAGALSLNGADAFGWEALAAYAADATTMPDPQRRGVICAPAEPEFDEKAADELANLTHTDAADWAFPIRNGIEVRSGAKQDAPVVDKLGLHLVRVLADDSPANAVTAAFLKVVTPSGKVGYVPVEAVLPIGGEQLCYLKEGGSWKIAGFLGGEPTK
jgi:hypothetical protein